ncbi:NADH:flavin oxidoreductase/NADH oxidase family protein [Mangrovitalea sediminis]|uniref:NADH:flavin oxidoreductase/NADH oxidase family protein n=1 Tax=Mangrovitalea sediminis TaxID=1982043 RepID=UPI000BE60DAC|nr:NADH:flavin oxidoreductase/NADH oxidase family protein [Mangrovitalea sediminis]
MSASSAEILGKPLTLPNGSVIRNRFAKSAMSEAIATIDNRVTRNLVELYRRWAEGGTGLLITGNVMIDKRHVGEPNNVVLENDRDRDLLKAWADAGTRNGTQLWMQLNHPGKQSPKMLNRDPVAPSAIPFGKALQGAFATPRPLTEAEIEEIIERFATSAQLAKQTGFTGVQIHGAHGYLVSQFLSPHHNQRTDSWGGSLENRMRFVVRVYEAMRSATGKDFNIGIKLNSADFQRGGFTEEESMVVAETLSGLGMDMIEISGGTYEAPRMAKGYEVSGGEPVKESTRQREAYFLEYAEKIRDRVSAPLMVTGGFRHSDVMAEAVASGATDLVGLARPLVIDPELPNRILAGESVVSTVRPIRTGVSAIDRMGLMETAWYARQLARMGKGKDPHPQDSGFWSLLDVIWTMSQRGFRTKLRA